MHRRRTATMLVLGILLTLPLAARPSAAAEGVSVIVNGRHVLIPEAFVSQGTTMVPLRRACAELACSVEYRVEGGGGRVEVTGGGRRFYVDLVAGSLHRPDGTWRALAAELRGGRLYVPLRVLEDELGGRVAWHGERRAAIVVQPGLIREELERLRDALEQSTTDLEAVGRMVQAAGWAWLAYEHHLPWVEASVPDSLHPHALFFWGSSRTRFLARVMDVPFSLDQRPYADRPVSLDVLLYFDLADPANALHWVGRLALDLEPVPVPELQPFLEPGLVIVWESGERPAFDAPLRVYRPGPGEWFPLRPRDDDAARPGDG